MALRAENIPAEPVNPIRVQACAWCTRDEMYIPLQDCMMCSHNRGDGETIYCGWDPGERPPCVGCGIPPKYCEPETCLIAQAKEKAADVVETAEEYILITF